ncbi:hypothetical protein KJ633_05365 [bacterium]|nr:hypothetical protein [bacterium]
MKKNFSWFLGALAGAGIFAASQAMAETRPIQVAIFEPVQIFLSTNLFQDFV